MMATRTSLVTFGLVWAGVLAPALAHSARAEEFHYLMVFGSQRVPPRPKYAHTFATFVRATGTGPCAENYSLEVHTISWVPRTLDIRVGALLPECGVNLDLDATLRWALATDQRVSLWGPYQIDQDLYERALAQISLLESGRVRYKALDFGYRTASVSNCIHAVSSLAQGYRPHAATLFFGEAASYLVLCRLAPWVIDCSRTHPWVSSRLGLDQYPLVRRPFEHPRGGLIREPIRALLGNHLGDGGGGR
jgi:hypothetical protein